MVFHKPVLVQEALSFLSPAPGKTYIDATLGHGGHTLEILKKGAHTYGIDQDKVNLKIATDRIAEEGLSQKFYPIHGNFSQLDQIVENNIKTKVDGVIFDLGLSQSQITSQNRGFSFNDEMSLDMRLDPELQETTAEFIINTASFDELYEIFTRFGQEKYAKPIVLRIIRERQKSPIKSGKKLADIIRNYYQTHNLKSGIDPATKIFMSLRIVINQEYSNLKSALSQTLEIVKPQGIVAVITFHSGEDRIVKQFVQSHLHQIDNLTPKAIRSTPQEVKNNPLSRSALLRSYKIK